ncbi:hypothetical protein G7K_5301-t1 [Saitoella complicata NRRL Y-17804]|uniref:Protein SDA1 n=1 Tax=Saitoella complicata (strain BCRC 22490 / CBS 7301 / JCM 7358 / NBRC 10748 / NRRL Y-17804) TaxID=698492 RepID=A0A0E9NP35_SAICN|nr:hypothetical protein G7K_5301-t1 [Saitoella complicata NRRL Y-17804]
MVKQRRAAVLPTNLPHLQYLVKRDPESYQDEFLMQWRHYESTRDIFLVKPEDEGTEFAELVGFMAHVSNCYPTETASFPNDLTMLLTNHHAVLHPDLREKLVQSLVLLRNKDVITSISLLQTLFPLLANTPSKNLRVQIYNTIVSDIRVANQKAKNHRLNKTVQSVLFGMVEQGAEDGSSTAGAWAVKLTREMWKRGIWDDARTVEIMKEAALHTNHKVMSGGIHFFLGADDEKAEASDSEEEEDISIKRVLHQNVINKGSKKRDKQFRQAIKKVHKQREKRHQVSTLNFSALHLLHDPQGFAEQLFSKHLTNSKTRLIMEQKLAVLQLVSRLIGVHKLSVLGFYSYILKFLSPSQRDVTHFLATAAQASHEFVPPDVLEPVIRRIADEFVTGGVAPEVVQAGINGIREMCARAPLAMNPTLLHDLTEYKGSRDKGVMMAARGLIGLYRDIAPEMLKKKDRGKNASMGMKTHSELKFGQELGAQRGIEGLELLAEWKKEQEANKGSGDEEEGEEDDWGQWEVESDENSEGEGDWIAVQSDGEDIEISDSEDEDGKKKEKTEKEKPVSRKRKAEEEEEESDEDMEDVEAAARVREELAAAEKRFSELATTKILTPADFAKLEELRVQAAANRILGLRGKQPPKTGEYVDAAAIEGPRKKTKADYAERMASVAEGREGREKFGSRKQFRDEAGRSTTNREKARKKNFMMIVHKRSVQGKSKRSLTEKQRVLRAHVDKQKKKGH